ncbi:DUF4097 domain-containing protein [bacterium]|nr:DUF4097 domain-containing protein [bacterium]MBU1650724.1 DUF4097 domain-containing protein [bacterium]
MLNQKAILTVVCSLLLVFFGIIQVQGKASSEIENLEKEFGGYSVSLTSTFDVSSGGRLVMQDLVGQVVIKGITGNKVTIVEKFFFDVDTEKEAESAFERYRAKIKQSGDRITVTGNDSNRRRYVTTSYDVTVPAKFNVAVETIGGDVRVQVIEGEVVLETMGGDLELTDVIGSIDAETAGGDINVQGLEGEARLSTAGGDIDLISAKKGPYRLRTAGGDITLRTIEGKLDAETSGGDVEVSDVTGDVDLGTSGGDIEISNVKGSSHRAKTSGGDVDANEITGDVDLSTSGGDVSAMLINGSVYGRTSGGNIDINDVNGDVDVSTSGGSLDIKSVMGRIQGKTSGGDVFARVQGNGMLKAPIRLSTSGGEITLQLPSKTKATVEAQIRTHDPYSGYNVHSDFKLKIEEDTQKGKKDSGWGRGYYIITATGEINGGGPLIELETVEGDINIEIRD